MKLKCSAIADGPILRAIARLYPAWANWPDLSRSFGDLPWNLQKAKLASLIQRGLVSGCACGCLGAFRLTDKGEKTLA